MGWWHSLSTRSRVGSLLVLGGAVLTVVVALLGSAEHPPGASTQALLTFLAICAQVGAAAVFGRDGRADPSLAQRSVARLLGLASRSAAARELAEAASAKGTPVGDVRYAIGHLSVHLSYLEEGYLEAIDDWKIFHPRAVQTAQLAFKEDGNDDE